MQFFPELFENSFGPEKYVARLFGFKVFSKKGSKYESRYDASGNLLNKKQIESAKNTVVLDPKFYPSDKKHTKVSTIAECNEEEHSSIATSKKGDNKEEGANNPEVLERSMEIDVS